MGKYIALGMMVYGVGSMLYQWLQGQRVRQTRLDAFLLFLQKSLYAMEREKMRLITYFQEYQSGDEVLRETLQEIGSRLGRNVYPHGELVWEEVFLEKKGRWNCDEETFLLLLNAGYGFFGGSRKENICFLQKSIQELEVRQKALKEKDAQERKVWLPVGMLGSLMFFIIFL